MDHLRVDTAVRTDLVVDPAGLLVVTGEVETLEAPAMVSGPTRSFQVNTSLLCFLLMCPGMDCCIVIVD